MTLIISLKMIKALSKKIHANHQSIVVAGGCFDLLHIGHINLLENAKRQGDILMVFLESDEHIKKSKGIDRPIHTQQQRATLLAALKAVDVVILLKANMQNKDYDTLLQEIQPSIIATTEHDLHIAHKQRQAKTVGAKIVIVNKYIPSISTTKLLQIVSKEI